MLSAILVVFLYISTVATNQGSAYCPCHIFVTEKGLQVAWCREQNLTTIPDCIPNTTQGLVFVHNDLRYSSGQFQRFTNLMYLWIFYNYNFAAHVDSLKFLSSLISLRLIGTDVSNFNGEALLYQSNLTFLRLSQNTGQLNVSKELFARLGKLRILNLSFQKTLEVPNWSFVGLPLLRELVFLISINLHFHKYSFSGLSALKNLNLGYPLDTINLPDEVFKPLINLEELHLEGLCDVKNASFDCTAIDKRLQHVPSIKRLYIDKTLLSHLGKGFLALENLKELYTGNSFESVCCGMTEIQPEYFRNLRHSPLTKLVIGQCLIETIRPGWFKYLPELKEISLSVIVWMYGKFWDDITTNLNNTVINKVRLSFPTSYKNNRPPSKPFTIVDGFNETQLTSLELTDTRFNSVNDDIITKLPKSLKYLNLTFNYISYFGVENLKYLENLETLDLSNQGDLHEQFSTEKGYGTQEYSLQNEFEMQEFSSHIRKEECNVRQMNPLQGTIQKRFNVIKTKCLSLPYRLQYLDVSKSALLCNNMFHAFCGSNNSLKVLKASVQRDYSCFKSRSFWSFLKNLAKIEELNLNGNLIAEIPLGAFYGLSKLRKLSLKNNKLIELSFNVKDLVSLETLDVSANSIQYAPNSFTKQIEDIPKQTNLTLYLRINILVCNCKQRDFVAWLVVTQVISSKNKLNCTFENGTKISIARMSHVYHILEYKCTRLDVTIGCTVIFWGLNILLGGLAYIWHNRQKLRYLVSFGRRTLNPYHPVEDCDIEMEYDVYISYEGDYYVTRDMTLRDFVIYKILPGLEQRRLKVMIREELDAGRNLYEIITHTVRRSKKVLAFLTNEYCNDMWNVFEFNQAVMEGIYTNRQVAIPVLFESLRREKVKEEIREFLRMEPVPKYSPELTDRAFIDYLYDRIRDTREFG